MVPFFAWGWKSAEAFKLNNAALPQARMIIGTDKRLRLVVIACNAVPSSLMAKAIILSGTVDISHARSGRPRTVTEIIVAIALYIVVVTFLCLVVVGLTRWYVSERMPCGPDSLSLKVADSNPDFLHLRRHQDTDRHEISPVAVCTSVPLRKPPSRTNCRDDLSCATIGIRERDSGNLAKNTSERSRLGYRRIMEAAQ